MLSVDEDWSLADADSILISDTLQETYLPIHPVFSRTYSMNYVSSDSYLDKLLSPESSLEIF